MTHSIAGKKNKKKSVNLIALNTSLQRIICLLILFYLTLTKLIEVTEKLLQ